MGEIPNNVFHFPSRENPKQCVSFSWPSTILKKKNTKDKPWCSYGGVIKRNLLLQLEDDTPWISPCLQAAWGLGEQAVLQVAGMTALVCAAQQGSSSLSTFQTLHFFLFFWSLALPHSSGNKNSSERKMWLPRDGGSCAVGQSMRISHLMPEEKWNV